MYEILSNGKPQKPLTTTTLIIGIVCYKLSIINMNVREYMYTLKSHDMYLFKTNCQYWRWHNYFHLFIHSLSNPQVPIHSSLVIDDISVEER